MIKQGFFNLIGLIIKIGTILLPIPILIKNLGVESYGVWIWCFSIIGSFQLFEGGFTLTIVHFLSKNSLAKEQNENNIFYADSILTAATITIFLAMLASGSLLFFSDYIASGLETKINKTLVKGIIKTSAIVLALKITQNIGWGIYQSNNQYGKYNFLTSIQVIVVNIGLIFISIKMPKSLNIMMQWVAIVYLTITIAQLLLLKNFLIFMKNGRLKYAHVIEQTKYAWSCWGSNLGAILYTHGDKLIVGNLLGAGNLAIYSTLTSIVAYISTIGSQLIHPVFPILSKLNHKNEKEVEITNALENALYLNVTITILVSFSLLIISDNLLHFLLKESYSRNTLQSFYMLIIIYSINSINAPGYYALLSINQNHTVMLSVLIFGCISLIMIYYGAKNLGITGAIYGNIGYSFTIILVYLALIKYKYKLYKWLKVLIIPFSWLLFVYLYRTNSTPGYMSYIIIIEITISVLIYSTLSWINMKINAPKLQFYLKSKFP